MCSSSGENVTFLFVVWFQASKLHVRAAQVAQDEVSGQKSGNFTYTVWPLFISYISWALFFYHLTLSV